MRKKTGEAIRGVGPQGNSLLPKNHPVFRKAERGDFMHRTRKIVKLGSLLLILTVLLMLRAHGQSPRDALESEFVDPPDSAKPRVWWHWMNGNITKEGIKLDLEWMKRVGIGGFQNFDAALNTPKLVDRRLVYMTPEWKDAFKYATTLADQLGLEMAIAGSPGWSESGGRGFGGGGRAQAPLPEFYADAAVVAFRAPDSDRPMVEMGPKVSAREAP